VADERKLLGHLAEARAELFAEGLRAIGELLFFGEAEGLERRRTGDRIAGISAAERARLARIDDLGAADDGADRKAPAHRLRHGHETRLHAEVLDRPHLAGAAEAALHLVDDEADAVLLRHLTEMFDEARRRDEKTAFAEDGLDDERADLARRDDGLEEL